MLKFISSSVMPYCALTDRERLACSSSNQIPQIRDALFLWEERHVGNRQLTASIDRREG
jgi:hypothetical protein